MNLDSDHLGLTEQGVLGSIMLAAEKGDRPLIKASIDALPAECFLEPRNKTIYRAIVSVHANGNLPDIVTVTTALGGELEHIGGTGYVSSLPNVVPSLSLLPQYVDALRSRFKRESSKSLGLRLMQGAEHETNLDAFLSEIGSDLRRLTQPTSGNDCEPEWRGDTCTFPWPAYGVTIHVKDIRETSHDGLRGVVSVETNIEGLLTWGDLNIPSTASRETLAKALSKSRDDIDWRRLLTRVCVEVAEHVRQGEPIEVLSGSQAHPPQYLVGPDMLPQGETSVFYGDGGSGKSTWATAVEVAITASVTLPHGFRPTARVNTLKLDYESTRDEEEEHRASLRRGLEAPATGGATAYYRRQVRAIADDVAMLRAEIASLKIGLVIVDSLAPACGQEPEQAEAATRTFNALRSLGTTNLVIAHVPKTQVDQRSAATRPFGSVFVWNLARSVWEIKRGETQDDNTLVFGLYHRKANRGRLHPPVGIRFEYGEGFIQVRPHDVRESADLLDRTSLAFRIQTALKPGDRTIPELAEETDAPEDTVRRTLSRLREKGKVLKLPDAGERKGRWGLADRR